MENGIKSLIAGLLFGLATAILIPFMACATALMMISEFMKRTD